MKNLGIAGGVAVGLAIALLAGTVPALAQSDEEVRAYWTPERLATAKPMHHGPSAVDKDGFPLGAGTSAYTRVTNHSFIVDGVLIQGSSGKAKPQKGEAEGPTDTLELNEKAYTPLETTQLTPFIVHPSTHMSGDYFTTTRVFPENSQPKVFPYAAAGNLFFKITVAGGVDPPGNFHCTASVIKNRIIATAGHCIGSPKTATGGNFHQYSNWMFIPGDMNGTAPFGTWTANHWGTSGPWSSGNGSVPNSEDWGFLAMNDLKSKKLASVTGHIGYYTQQLSSNNVTMLGYPNNLDSGARMQQNQAQIAGSGGSNTYTLGSAMGPGSSGGPWIMDFGQAPACSGTNMCPPASGSPDTNKLGGNYLIAVTSYGPTGTIGYEGASNLNSDWISLLNTMCGFSSGNC